MVGTAIVVLIIFAAFTVFDFRSNVYVGLISGFVGIVVVSAVLAFASITVQVDQKRVTAKSTVFRFKLANIRLDEISAVTTESFSKVSWGGWGLRLRGRDKAIVLTGTAAAVIEKKNGIKVYLATQEAPRITEVITRLRGT